MEKQWDYFFDQIIQEVEKNTNEGVVEALACNFSTTDKVHKVISTSIIMSSFKKFFNYVRECGDCGISNVYFAGIRDDWEKVLSKLSNLRKYDVDGVLAKYVDHVEVILKKFLDTYDGNPDVSWWNTVMETE